MFVQRLGHDYLFFKPEVDRGSVWEAGLKTDNFSAILFDVKITSPLNR